MEIKKIEYTPNKVNLKGYEIGFVNEVNTLKVGSGLQVDFEENEDPVKFMTRVRTILKKKYQHKKFKLKRFSEKQVLVARVK